MIFVCGRQIPYFNNFALDPHRIQPFSHPPPPTNSNSQAAPPQAYGIQGPPVYHGGDYGRPPYYGGGAYGPGYPPPYQNGYWDPHSYAGGPYGPPGYPATMVPSRRDEATVARRLSRVEAETEERGQAKGDRRLLHQMLGKIPGPRQERGSVTTIWIWLPRYVCYGIK